MKSFFIRIFLFICAIAATFGGILLFLVGLKRISPKDAISFYSFVLQTPPALSAALWVGLSFSCLGFILFFLALRSRIAQKSILIREGGEILRIPIDAVKDFIDHILLKNPHLNAFDTMINNKGKWIYINIFPAFNDAVSIRQQVSHMRKILKEEIERVFEFSYLRINFQMRTVSVDPERNFFGTRIVNKDQIGDEERSLEQALNQQADAEPEEGILQEESSKEKKLYRKMPWRFV